jgi:hypothetical protein
MSNPNTNALEYLASLSGVGFWGTVALKFENGQVVHVRQEENLKPSELSGKPRGSHGNTKN